MFRIRGIATWVDMLVVSGPLLDAVKPEVVQSPPAANVCVRLPAL